MNECIFCQIIAGKIPSYKVYEDGDFFAILDRKPIHLGHTLLLPKRHERNILELSDELAPLVAGRIRDIAAAVKKATGADGINIGINNEAAAGQIIFHTHIHIIPRFDGDGFEHWHGKTIPTDDDYATMKEKIAGMF